MSLQRRPPQKLLLSGLRCLRDAAGVGILSWTHFRRKNSSRTPNPSSSARTPRTILKFERPSVERPPITIGRNYTCMFHYRSRQGPREVFPHRHARVLSIFLTHTKKFFFLWRQYAKKFCEVNDLEWEPKDKHDVVPPSEFFTNENMESYVFILVFKL